MSMVHGIAVITAKPGMREQVLELVSANVPAVKEEDGCIEYGATVDADGVGGFQARYGDDTFVVIEKWACLDHLKAHAVSEHMKEYGAKTKDMLADRVIHVMSSAS